MTLMKLRLDLHFTNLSQHFEICLVVFDLNFFIRQHGLIGDLKSFVS